MVNQLVRDEKRGAVIVTKEDHSEVEYAPRARGDRWPWRLAGPADNGTRYSNQEVRAQWQH